MNALKNIALSSLAAASIASQAHAQSPMDGKADIMPSPQSPKEQQTNTWKSPWNELVNNNAVLGELSPKNPTLSLGYHSKYLGTYGFTMSENTSLTEELGFDIGKLHYSFWNNHDVKKGWTESDHMFSTSLDTKYFIVKPDAIAFTSPVGVFHDAVTLGVGVHSKGLPLDISLYGVQAIGEGTYRGQLLQFRAGKTFSLDFISKRLSLSLETRATFNNRYFVNAGGASLNYDFGKGYSASAGTRFQKAFNSLGGTFKDNSVFEFGLTKKF
jgi:hypothetical protein